MLCQYALLPDGLVKYASSSEPRHFQSITRRHPLEQFPVSIQYSPLGCDSIARAYRCCNYLGSCGTLFSKLRMGAEAEVTACPAIVVV